MQAVVCLFMTASIITGWLRRRRLLGAVHNSRDWICINWNAAHGPSRGLGACRCCRPGDEVSPDLSRARHHASLLADSGLVPERRVSLLDLSPRTFQIFGYQYFYKYF